jgi:hypothetical protein
LPRGAGISGGVNTTSAFAVHNHVVGGAIVMLLSGKHTITQDEEVKILQEAEILIKGEENCSRCYPTSLETV